MNLPASLPPEKRSLLLQLVDLLARIPNLAAVVLGGSYASGAQHPASDLDLGLYYHEAAPFAIEDIRQAAQAVALPGSAPLVTGFYEWGAWVNGGAWIQTPAGKVDFLYRSIEHVQRTIDEALAGGWRHDYDQQPANGFYSLGYLAETRICLPLHDPAGLLQALKQRVQDYPPALKQKVIADSLWSVDFTLQHASGFAEKGDIYNTAGCLVRAAAGLTQALFALNETYFLGDKKAIEKLAGFPLIPPGHVAQVLEILACPGSDTSALQSSVGRMRAAWQNVAALTTSYRPRF